MNPIVVRILKDVSQEMNSSWLKFLEELHELHGKSFVESLLFWGLTQPGSSEECWSRTALTDYHINGNTPSKVEKEIYQRILGSNRWDRRYNLRIRFYFYILLRREDNIPKTLFSTLRRKFRSIY